MRSSQINLSRQPTSRLSLWLLVLALLIGGVHALSTKEVLVKTTSSSSWGPPSKNSYNNNSSRTELLKSNTTTTATAKKKSIIGRVDPLRDDNPRKTASRSMPNDKEDYWDQYMHDSAEFVLLDDEDFDLDDEELYYMDDWGMPLYDDYYDDFMYDDDDERWWEFGWLDHHQPLHLNMSPEEIEESFVPPSDQPHFLIPRDIPPGQVEPIRWRDTQEIIHDDEMFVVGLPHELLDEFRSYFDDVGVVDLVQHLLFPTKNDTDTPASDHTDTDADAAAEHMEEDEQSHVWPLADGHRWNVRRASHWPTDMVWFDPADEACYERLYEVMKRGKFDIVLKALQEQLLQPNLVVHGIGAIFNSHFDAEPDEPFAQLHRDVPGTRGAFYNILIPVYLPEADGDEASLHIGGDEEDRCAPINLRYNLATVIGSDSWHGTGECDYRSSKGFRLSMSIWVSEIFEDTLEVISTDGLSPWPLMNDKQWYWAQRFRTNITNDTGRAPIARPPRDLLPDCHEVMDMCDFWDVRFDCPRTCGLYMETDEYYSNLQSLRREMK